MPTTTWEDLNSKLEMSLKKLEELLPADGDFTLVSTGSVSASTRTHCAGQGSQPKSQVSLFTVPYSSQEARES